MEKLPTPRDADEAQRLRDAYRLGAFDVLESCDLSTADRLIAQHKVRRLARMLWPAFMPQEASR